MIIRTLTLAAALAFALTNSSCVIAEDTSRGAAELATLRSQSSQNETADGEEEGVGTAAQSVETGCMQACMDAWDQDNAVCRRIPNVGDRRRCWEQANQKLAACLKNCPY